MKEAMQSSLVEGVMYISGETWQLGTSLGRSVFGLPYFLEYMLQLSRIYSSPGVVEGKLRHSMIDIRLSTVLARLVRRASRRFPCRMFAI